MVEELDGALAALWSRLAAAVTDREAPLHTLTLATGAATAIDVRTLVLRAVAPDAARLRFHTDQRAAKVAALRTNPGVALLGYDAPARLQLRLYGSAAIHTEGAEVDAAWEATSAFGRRAYQTTAAPGSALDAPGSGLPTLPAPDGGRCNFALINVTLDRLEWLHLAHGGHHRAAYQRDGNDWQGRWLVP